MMIHPILKLAASQPHLLADHASAYAELVAEEAKAVSASWLRRIAFYAGAALLALIGIVLIGVALLVAAVTLPEQRTAEWALFVVPLTPLVVAAILVVIARSRPLEKAISKLKAQFEADKALLDEVVS